MRRDSGARRFVHSHDFEVRLMVNRDVLATFPCRVRRRGQALAASLGQLPSRRRLRAFDRCRSLSYYRRVGYVGTAHRIDVS
jgi:hypothetical protein